MRCEKWPFREGDIVRFKTYEELMAVEGLEAFGEPATPSLVIQCRFAGEGLVKRVAGTHIVLLDYPWFYYPEWLVMLKPNKRFP